MHYVGREPVCAFSLLWWVVRFLYTLCCQLQFSLSLFGVHVIDNLLRASMNISNETNALQIKRSPHNSGGECEHKAQKLKNGHLGNVPLFPMRGLRCVYFKRSFTFISSILATMQYCKTMYDPAHCLNAHPPLYLFAFFRMTAIPWPPPMHAAPTA